MRATRRDNSRSISATHPLSLRKKTGSTHGNTIALYRRRNEIERLFRLKGFRRILSRFEKLDVMFVGFIHFALIMEAAGRFQARMHTIRISVLQPRLKLCDSGF